MRDKFLLGRRALFAGIGVVAVGSAFPRLALASAPTDKRFVLIILRGAMDGLNVVVPYGDRDYAGLRRDIAIANPGTPDGAIDLNGFYGLHPALAPIAGWYKEGMFLPIHAVASSYRERSHFDGQDLLENGTLSPRNTDSGWLNRAIAVMGGGDRRLGLAVGQTIPLVLRGGTPVASWAPTKLPEANENFLALVQAMYQGDPLLAPALADGIRATASADLVMASDKDMKGADMGGPAKQKAQIALADAAGRMLADPNGPRIAVFDALGWDTHAGQGAVKGRLAGALDGLVASLTALRVALGPTWKDTVVVMATEFGRTVHANGTGGTDHGTASAMLLAGGGIAGGRVAGTWPGLAEGKLYQSRDLMPTTDMRSVLKAVLRNHMGLPGDKLDGVVFPGSADAKPMANVTLA